MDYPNLRHVRLFCACVRSGSLTQAAESVAVSQPAASQAITRLEAFYGSQLLERHQRRTTPTADGLILQARAMRALEFIRNGCQRLRAGSACGTLPAETRLTIGHLTVLQALDHAGGFMGAAAVLGQSVAAVQRMARNAEAVLEAALFEMDGHSLRLTASGRMAARWSALALRELKNAGEELQESRGLFDGLVSIGALPMARTTIVPDAIALLAGNRPGARFEIIEGSYEQLLGDLEMGHVDLLIGALRDRIPAALVQEPLFEFRLSLVARCGHPLASQGRLALADLARFPWVVARKGTPNRGIFDSLAARFADRNNVLGTVETGSLTALRGILQQSDRLALLSRHQIRHELLAGSLTVLDFPLSQTPRMVGMTMRRDWYPTSLQGECLEAVRRVVALEEGCGGQMHAAG